MLIQGDCIEGMKELQSESIDLIVTDPPYLMNYQSNHRSKENRFDRIQNDVNAHGMITEYIEQCHRLLKPDSGIYMFCSWHHIDFFKQEFEKKFQLKNVIVWNKNNHGSGDLTGAYAPKHELILFGAKGRHILKERVPDVISCARVDVNSMVHPTEKPVDLLKIFIRNSSKEGDTVLDGFAGSGSTLLAASQLGRQYIGFELDERYVAVANKRLGSIQAELF